MKFHESLNEFHNSFEREREREREKNPHNDDSLLQNFDARLNER